MCIDAPESTTNSRSSGLRFDADNHLFSEGEKNITLSYSQKLKTLSFGQIPRCFAGTSLLLLCLFLRPILKFWSVGASLMRFTWANHSERTILFSNFGVTCNSFREFHMLDWFLHVWALPENRLRRLYVLKYTTQLSCVIRRPTSPRFNSRQVSRFMSSRPDLSGLTMVDNELPYIFIPIILLPHYYCTLVIIFWTF